MRMADPVLTVAVLAAGSGRRFGGGKLDALLAGKPVGAWVLDAVRAAGLPSGIIITGPVAPSFAHASGWAITENPHPDRGLGSSLALAARTARGRLLVLLADMPLVSGAYLARLCTSGGAAATLYPDAKCGVPAIFPQTLLPQLGNLTGDAGAGSILKGLPDLTLFDPPEQMLLDIDRPADLHRVEAILRGG